MKLRTLIVAVGFLAVLSAIVFWTGRPPAPAAADPRVGQGLVDPEEIEKAAALRISDQGKTVMLTREPGGGWRDVSYFGLSADFSKLSGWINDLTTAKIQRFVTSNPSRLERLEFKDAKVEFLDAGGRALWSITLGRNADKGGRFVRFNHEDRAYLTDLSSSLDTDPKNWADAQLLNFKPEDIARIEVAFGEGGPVIVQRRKKDDPWTAIGVRTTKGDRPIPSPGKISSLLTTLGSLRFSDTVAPADPQVAAAMQHERVVKLTAFDGRTTTITLAQKPALKVPATGSGQALQPKAENPGQPPATPEEPPAAGPTYVFITSSDANAPINAMMQKRAFQIDDYVITSLPQKPVDLF